MDTMEKTLAQYLDELGVKVSVQACEMPENAPEWAKGIQSFRYKLTYNGKNLSSYFFAGWGVKQVTRESVVADLARCYDASVYTLQEFGDEYGWNADTYQCYKLTKSLASRFKKLFSDDDIRMEIAELAMDY